MQPITGINRIITRDGKDPDCSDSVLFGFYRLPRFGSVRVLVKYLKTGFGFCSGSGTTEVRFGSGSFHFSCI